MVTIVRHYLCDECGDSFDTMVEAKEHEKECKVVTYEAGGELEPDEIDDKIKGIKYRFKMGSISEQVMHDMINSLLDR